MGKKREGFSAFGLKMNFLLLNRSLSLDYLYFINT